MRKTLPVLLLTTICICTTACGTESVSESKHHTNLDTTELISSSIAQETLAPTPTVTSASALDTTPTLTSAPALDPTPTTAPTPEHRIGENIIGISDKDVFDIGEPSKFSRDKVRNDVTGKWRISTIAENIDIKDYALSYYKKYFHNDSEIHAIVNFNNNTTTSITYLSGLLFVDTYDYVKGEEHDANILFSGTHLSQVVIYTDNGDIEKISN